MKQMQNVPAQLPLLDRVWAAAKDGRWYTVEDLAKRVPYTGLRLVEAVTFLVKYGFAEPSPSGERFRMITDCPAPSDAANGLRSISPASTIP
jgi:hypothetical protein